MKTGVLVVAFLVDQLTKYGMTHLFCEVSGRREMFSFGVHRNYGISFSMLASIPRAGLWIGLFGCFCLTGVLLRFRDLRAEPGMALMLAGALGNTTDRVFRGYVVDWFYIGLHVNAADIFLCLGGVLLLLHLLQADGCGKIGLSCVLPEEERERREAHVEIDKRD